MSFHSLAQRRDGLCFPDFAGGKQDCQYDGPFRDQKCKQQGQGQKTDLVGDSRLGDHHGIDGGKQSVGKQDPGQ